MRSKYSAKAIFAILLFVAGCTGPVYIQQTDTPNNLDGFLGFRWVTPLSILDDYLLENFDVIPCSRYNNYYTLSYENYYFMEKKASMCQFIFDDYGSIEAHLFFLLDANDIYSEMDYFLEKLTDVYGSPVQMTRPAYKIEYAGYIEGYYWFDGRLSITLMPGDVIIIRAFKYNQGTPDGPPLIHCTRVIYDVKAPPVYDQRSVCQ